MALNDTLNDAGDFDTPAFGGVTSSDTDTGEFNTPAFGGISTEGVVAKPKRRFDLYTLTPQGTPDPIESQLVKSSEDRFKEISEAGVTEVLPDLDPKLSTEDAQEGELPYFPGPFDAPEFQAEKDLVGDKPEGAVRTGAYLTQEAVKGLTGMADVAVAAVDSAPLIGWVKHVAAQYAGVVPKDQPYSVGFGDITQSYKEKVLPAAFTAAGYPKVSELDAESDLQRGAGFLAENLAGGASIKLGQMAYKAWKGVGAPFLDDFLKADVISSTLGAGTGAVTYSVFDDPENKETAGYLGNFVGSMIPALKHMTSLYAGKKAMETYRKRSGELEDLSDKLIDQDLQKLVNIEDVPMIKQRIKFFKQLQETPEGAEFIPTWSSVIQTPYAKNVQAWTDLQNPERATSIYESNRKVVNNLIDKYGLDPKGEHTQAIQEAMFHVAYQGDEVSRSLSKQIDSVRDEISQVGRSSVSEGRLASGLEFRDQLETLQRHFSSHIDNMYAQIDPDNTIKIPLQKVHKALSSARDATKRGAHTGTINYSTDTAPHLLHDLDAIAKKLDPASYEGAANTSVRFNQMIEQRKQLDRVAKMASGVPGGSQATDLANKMARGLDEMLDTHMEQLAPDTLGAYKAARSSYRDSYLPHFVQENNVIVRHLSTNRTGEYRVAADTLLKDVWQEGGKELNATQINGLLEEASGIVDPEVLTTLREVLNTKVLDHATSSLNEAIRNTKAPAEAFRRWVTSNEANLNNFPHVRTNVDEIGKDLSLKETGLYDLIAQEKHARKALIDKYSGVDSELFLEELSSKSAAEAMKTMKELFHGQGVKDPFINLPFKADAMIDRLSQLSPSVNVFLQKLKKQSPEAYQQAFTVQTAVSEEILSELIRKGMRNDAFGGLDNKFFNSIFNGNNNKYRIDTLREIMTPESFQTLNNFHKLANATQETFTASGKIDLGSLAKLEDSLGVSFSSVSSRIYAAKLGKVGPVFVVTDTGLKLLKAEHGQNFKDALTSSLYDMESLERLLERRLASASSGEKAIITEQVSKIKALRKNIPGIAKRSVSSTGKFLVGQFSDAIAHIIQHNPSELRAYIESRQDDGKDRIGHMIQVNGTLAQGLGTEPTEEQWAEYRASRDALSNPVDIEEPEVEEAEVNGSPVIQEQSPDFETNDTEGLDTSPAGIVISSFEQAGLSPETGLAFAHIESSLDPEAKAGSTSAEGLFQFIDKTWNHMVSTYGDKYGINTSNARKTDPRQNSLMAVEYLKENALSLEKRGFKATDYNLYAAHFLGASGAGKFLTALKAAPKKKISEVVGQKSVDSNPGVFRVKVGQKWGREKTVSEVMDTIRQKIDKAKQETQSFLSNKVEESEA